MTFTQILHQILEHSIDIKILSPSLPKDQLRRVSIYMKENIQDGEINSNIVDIGNLQLYDDDKL